MADIRIGAAIATTIVLWASVFAANRAVLPVLAPGHLVVLRFLIASGALALAALVRPLPRPALRDLPAIAGLGLLGITIYQLALVYGQRTVTAGAASLIINSESIWIALLALPLLGERLTGWGWTGTVASFLGVVLIVVGEGGAVQLSRDALLVLLAAWSTSVYFVLQKPYLRRYPAFALNAYCIWAGTLLTLPFGVGLPAAVARTAPQVLAGVAYLGFFPGALAYFTWTYALARIPASIAGNTLYLIAPLAIVMAWVWLREIPAALSLLGGVLILTGVALVQWRGRPPTPAPS